MQSIEKIKRIVSQILAERFDDITILSVNIDRDVDEDDNPILLVRVVFDGKAKNLDAKKASGIVRTLLPALADADERAFPILSFISKADLGKLSPETA